MRFTLNLLATLAVAATALAQPARRAFSLNPDASVVRPIDDVPNTGPITNAKRFAMHLPPLMPRTLRRAHGAPRAPTRVQAAPRAESSPLPPSTTKCNVLAKNVDGSVIGFVAAAFNKYGEYGLFQGSQDGALEVVFSDAPGSQMDMYANNAPSSSHPFVGAISGFASTDDDFGPGSYNYAFIGGTSQTAPGSAAVPGENTFFMATGFEGNYQSAIWGYNPTSQAITAQWMNSDGSAPPTQILYANDENQALCLTGDAGALRSAAESNYPEITLTCVPCI